LWFVERGLKVDSMLGVSHQYCYVHRYNRENYEFEVQEILTPHQY